MIEHFKELYPKLFVEDKNYQIGKTKVFMKETLRNALDAILVSFKMTYIIKIQRMGKIYAFKKSVLRNLKNLA